MDLPTQKPLQIYDSTLRQSTGTDFQTYMSGVGCSGGYQGSTYFLKKDPLRLFTVTARLGPRTLVECRRTLPIILCKRRKFFDLSQNQDRCSILVPILFRLSNIEHALQCLLDVFSVTLNPRMRRIAFCKVKAVDIVTRIQKIRKKMTLWTLRPHCCLVM